MSYSIQYGHGIISREGRRTTQQDVPQKKRVQIFNPQKFGMDDITGDVSNITN